MARRKRPMKWTAGATLIALVVAVLFGIAGYLTIGEFRLGTRGVRTEGTVTKYEKRGRSVYWTIAFTHDGNRFSADIEPSMFSGLELGQKVPILVDPSDPKHINLDKFMHRWFYQALAVGMGLLFLAGLPLLLYQSDDDWLTAYVTKEAEDEDSRADRLAREFYTFLLMSGSRATGGIAHYFNTYGLARWADLKEAWDPKAVPSLEPVIAEIERVIEGRDPGRALAGASPKVEKFFYGHRPAIVAEIRDALTDPEDAK